MDEIIDYFLKKRRSKMSEKKKKQRQQFTIIKDDSTDGHHSFGVGWQKVLKIGKVFYFNLVGEILQLAFEGYFILPVLGAGVSGGQEEESKKQVQGFHSSYLISSSSFLTSASPRMLAAMIVP